MSYHLVKLLFKIFKTYDVLITQNAIEQTILTHPIYPSIQCISDAFDKWKISHIILKLTFEKLCLLDVPVIAHLNRDEYVWIKQIKNNKVYYWDSREGNKMIGCDEFEKIWSGLVLAIEDINQAGEPDYREKHKKELTKKIINRLIPGTLVFLFAILLCFTWMNDRQLPLLHKIILTGINSLGLYISYILLSHEHKKSNKLIDKFCRAGNHVDCNKVTESSQAKLFGIISWAELGTAFFASITIWIGTGAFIADMWYPVLALFFLLPLPFTIWSLIVQAFVVRKWCLFCCFVVLLLWLNAIMIYFIFPAPVFPDFVAMIPSIILLLLIFTCNFGLLYGFGKIRDYPENLYEQKRETARIKYDLNTIRAQLTPLAIDINETGFIFGNDSSKFEIGLFVSIACSHCAKAIQQFKETMYIYPQFRYRLIYAVYDNNKENKAIVTHFVAYYKEKSTYEFMDMLESWYAQKIKTPDELQKYFQVASARHDNVIEKMKKFTEEGKISYTPAIFLDGKILFQQYSYHDIYGIARTLSYEE